MPQTQVIQEASVGKDPFLPQGNHIAKSYVITAGETYGGKRLFPKGALMAEAGGKLVEYIELGGGANAAVGALQHAVLMDSDVTLDIDCSLIVSSTGFKVSECDNWGTGTAAGDPDIEDNFHLIV